MPGVVDTIAIWLYLNVGTSVATSIFIANLTVSTLLSLAASKLFGPKMPGGAGLSGLQVTTRSALEYRKIVYGEAMVSGPIVYTNLSGGDGQHLWYVIALAEGLSEDITSVWFDGDAIPKADIDWDAAAKTGGGDVSTAKWVGANSTTAAHIFYYLGASDQTYSVPLAGIFDDIGSNHRYRGVTYMVAKLVYDADTENVWKAGVPSNFKALVKGRLIYDPRLDGTRVIDTTTSPYGTGTGAHRLATASTWAWSENPALCVADYLTQVMGVADASIDWESIANAADDCEVAAAIPTASTEDRFTCNGVLSLGSTHKDNLDKLLSSCDGKLSYSSGTWKLRASVWEASSVSIVEDDIVGTLQVRGSAPEGERFNRIRGYFIDPSRNYEAVEFPHVVDTSYLTRDNSRVLDYDMELPMTNTETMAQRIAFRNVQQGDNQVVCEVELNASGAKIAVGDIVDLTVSDLSWSAKTFRVIEWARTSSGTFKVALREDVAASYTDPIEGDYNASNTGGVTIPADVMPPPTGLTATSGVGGIRLDWTNPPNATYDYIDIYEDTNDSWAGAGLIASVRANSFFVPRAAGTTYYYWVRAVRAPDLESLRSPDSDTTTISAAATGGSDGDSLFYASTFKRNSGTPSTPSVDDGQYNFTTQTLTPPTGWSATIPAVGSPTLPVYVSHGTFSISGTTGTDTTVTWSAPALMAQDGADGAPGAAGYNTATLTAYKRSAADPGDDPGASITYTFATAGWTPGNSWSKTIPAAGSPTLPVWAVSATARSQSATDDVLSADWSGATQILQDGIDGTDGGEGAAGLSVATVFIYQRTLTDSAPASNPADGSEYTFATGGLTFTTANGWTATIPAQTSPESPYLWMTMATASGSGATDTILNSEWQTAQKLAADGSDGSAGTAGYNTATLTAYKRSAADPGDDPGVSITYTFATAGWTPGNSWSKTIPAAGSPTLPVWAVSATAYSNTATDDVLSADWSAAAQILQDGIDGTDGGEGAAGLNVATAYIYQRTLTDSAPSVPSGTTTYTFATGGMSGLNNGWTATIPAQTSPESPYLWATLATASSADATDDILTGEWQTPQKLAADGSDGAGGAAGISTNLSNPSPNVSAWSDGTNYSLTGTGGTHLVYEGATDITSSCTHTVVGGADNSPNSTHGKTQNGLTMTVTKATGVYALSGESWTSDSEQFTLRATYNAITYDKVFTITKTSSGGATFGDVSDFNVTAVDVATTQRGGFRVDSDGDIWRRIGGTGSSYTSIQTWIGDGAGADYECKVTKPDTLHDDPDITNAGLGTWLACSSDRTWEWEASSGGDDEYAELILQFRRVSDNLLLATVNIIVDVEYI